MTSSLGNVFRAPHRLRGSIVTLTACLLLAGPSNAANIPAATLSVADGYPKDFVLVKHAGLFHVFHIESGLLGDSNQLGHQTSPDLYHWTVHPPVLVEGRNGWNRDFVWAPSIVKRDSVYTMFYTGVRQRGDPENCSGVHLQQIGAATSTDLFNWSLELDSWLDPAEVPWTIAPQDSCVIRDFGNFRDPFVMPSPDGMGWLMYYVAPPNSTATSENIPSAGTYDSRRMVVAIAKAPLTFAGDLDWTDRQALWVTHEAYVGGPGFRTWESPHLFSRTWQGADLWFLFASVGHSIFADEVDFMTGPSPTAPQFQKAKRPGWTWRGRIDNLNCLDSYGNQLNSHGWFATEYFRDPETGLEYLANCRNPVIEIRQLKWRTSSYGFDLEQPFAVTAIVATPQAVVAGTLVDLRLIAKNANDGGPPKRVAIEAIRVGADGESLAVLPLPSLGLPDSVLITSDQTHLVWVPPAPSEPVVALRIKLMYPGTPVRSEVLTVYPATAHGGSDPRGGKDEDFSLGTPSESNPGSGSEPAKLGLHALAAESGVVVQLPSAADVRVELFDVNGRRVRVLAQGELPRGSTRIRWDGKDAFGNPAGPGIYFVRLETGAGVRSARLSRLR